MNRTKNMHAARFTLFIAAGVLCAGLVEERLCFLQSAASRALTSCMSLLEQRRLARQAAALDESHLEYETAIRHRQALDQKVHEFQKARTDVAHRLNEHRRALKTAWNLLDSRAHFVVLDSSDDHNRKDRAQVARDVQQLLRSCEALEQEVGWYEAALTRLAADLGHWDARLEEIQRTLQIRERKTASDAAQQNGMASRDEMIHLIEQLESANQSTR